MRSRSALPVLAFAGLVASFMQTILVPIQAELPRLLNARPEDTAWAVTITLLAGAISNPVSGRLGDMFGKRRVALVLLALLVSGSVVAALSSGVVPLIVGRALQGLGMAAIPVGISILRDILPVERLTSAVALMSATLGVGGALGLPISALVTQYFDWHALFWLAAALGVIAFALVAWVVPPSVLRSGGRVDLVGIAGLAVGLGGVLLAVSRGSEWGWTAPLTLGLLIGGVVVLLAWGWYELRTKNPLVDLRVSARGPVLTTNLASIAMGFALFASSIAFPQLLELPAAAGGLGLSLLLASLVLMPSGVAMLVMSPIAGRLERRRGPKALLIAGAAVIAVGYLIAALLQPQVWLILVVNIVIGIGVGLGYAAMPTLIMRSVPSTETGAANGLNTLMRGLGTATGAAVIAATLTQSSTDVGGVQLPTIAGFQQAFALGLAAAVVSALIAIAIPRPRPHAGEHEAMPAGLDDGGAEGR